MSGKGVTMFNRRLALWRRLGAEGQGSESEQRGDFLFDRHGASLQSGDGRILPAGARLLALVLGYCAYVD